MRGLSAMARLVLSLGLVGLLLAGVACGSDDSGDSAKKGAGASGSVGTVDASGTILITGKDHFFEPKQFTGKAGQKTTVNFENKGAAIHNFVIKDQKGPSGQEIQSQLLPAGQKEAVEFTLAAGTYEYYCSVHPVEMRGTITVQ